MTDFRLLWGLHAYSGGTVPESHRVLYSPIRAEKALKGTRMPVQFRGKYTTGWVFCQCSVWIFDEGEVFIALWREYPGGSALVLAFFVEPLDDEPLLLGNLAPGDVRVQLPIRDSHLRFVSLAVEQRRQAGLRLCDHQLPSAG